MNIRTASVELRSKAPLLMHRYTGEKPPEPKPTVAKKTQEWIDGKHKKDWIQSAYFDRGMFHIPPEVIESAMVSGARKFRKGKSFQGAVMVEEDFIPLMVYDEEFKNGRALKGNLEDFYLPEYIDLRGVRIQQARIDRCRPIFRFWGLSFTIRFD
ncbi:hypothetical protein LCGC14_1670300, partial [marine sediment metagenome]